MRDLGKRRMTVEKTQGPLAQAQHSAPGDPFDFSPYRPEDAARLYVYQYQHLDDLSFVRKPEDVFAGISRSELKRLTEAVAERFRVAGWEGDGTIGIVWLPPFVEVGVEDTWGTYLWHVKQENNGTSWIGSKYTLDFGRIKDQNEPFPYKTHVRVSVIYDAALTLFRSAEATLNRLRNRIAALDKLDGSQVDEIANELRLSAQGELTSALHMFLDDCYFEILTDVLEHGNRSNLHLSKFKVSVDLSHSEPFEDRYLRDREREEIQKWLTLKGLINDVWSSFTFEPFAIKMQLLFRACEYKLDDKARLELTKHVLLRNCVQHHNRTVTIDALKNSGVKSFSVLNERSKATLLKAGDSITFSLPELDSFGQCLIKLAGEFDLHVGKRVRSFNWVPRGDLPQSKGEVTS